MKNKSNGLFSLIIVLAMLTWAGSWVSAKIIEVSVPSEIIIFWRFIITFISLIPIIIYLKPNLSLNFKGVKQIILGAIFLVIYNFLFINGVRLGLASEGGVIVTTLNPLFTFLLSALIFRQKIKNSEKIGLIIGLIGGCILFEVWNICNSNFMNGADSLFLFAAISWALLSIVSQNSKLNMSPFVFSLYTYGLAAFINFFFALSKGLFNISAITFPTWINILYLSIAATTFGTTAYFFAASKIGARKASSFTFVIPSSAVIFSYLFLHEKISIITIIGGLLALIAVYLINYQKSLKN